MTDNERTLAKIKERTNTPVQCSTEHCLIAWEDRDFLLAEVERLKEELEVVKKENTSLVSAVKLLKENFNELFQ